MDQLMSTPKLTTTTSRPIQPQQQATERKGMRPQREEAINCPRCNSTNTKFCYYNNYSLTQPRYFCKTCRRYWTQGGSLRNVPVGGGSRKNKRPNSSSILAPNTSNDAPKSLNQGQDLNLAFSHNNHVSNNNGSSNVAMELMRNGGNFMGIAMPDYANGFGLHDMRTSSTNGSRVLFAFEDLKPVIPTTSPGATIASGVVGHEFEMQRGPVGDPLGFWNGIIGHGGSWLN